jgi:predicted O-methyltransferase YrrM
VVGLVTAEEPPDALRDYLDRLLPPRDSLASEIEAVAGARGASDPHLGRYLSLTARGGVRRVLQLGAGWGYPQLALLRGGPDIELAWWEEDEDRARIAQGFLDRAGFGGGGGREGGGGRVGGERATRIALPRQEALSAMFEFAGTFDLLLLESPRVEFRRFLDGLLPKLAVGGTVLAVGVLAEGRVADWDAEEDGEVRALRAFNPYFSIHPQLRTAILPIAGGLAVGVKTKPLITETGGPW